MIVAEAVFDLDEIVAAYERRAATDPAADFADDLPPGDHPLYESALRELVRVQMEFRAATGQVPSAGYYFTRFPELRQADARQEICFEEYRLRRLAGELPDPEEFAECYGVDISTWPTTKPRENDIASSARAYLKGAGSTGKAGRTVSPYPENASTQLFQALERADPKVALQLATALTEFPEVGSDYHGYQLIDELGRGAFSRVYLALEDAVDGRCVALKVTGDARTEVAALARLRHTNIVPVYSVREFGLHQTVCMPFCGGMTLADVLRRRAAEMRTPRSGKWLANLGVGGPVPKQWLQQTFVEAATDLAWRLAEGLAHAHDRGILHRDLKPANILLADDGEPLLLDFNLADGKGMAGKVESAYVGGTLPYMAPEQIRYYAGEGPQSDARADVYAIGLILYELLTGRPTVAWPGGSVKAALTELSKARALQPDNARKWNPDVSPALAAIVAKCLMPDPEQRYPSARELADDLAAQRRHEPLRHQREPSWSERAAKWVRRHPSVTSGATVATVAAGLLFAAAFTGFQIHQDRQLLAQRDNYRLFDDEVRAAQIALAHPSPDPEQWKLGTTAARRAWDRFPDASPELPEERGRLAYLLARSEWQAAGRTADPAVRQQHLDAARHWNEHAGRLLNSGPLGAVVRDQSRWLAEPKTLDEVALAAGTPDSADAFLSGQILLGRNRPREAATALARATQSDPTSVLAWYTRGMAAQSAGRLDDALSSFSACVALSPKRSDVWRARGNVLHEMGRDDDALPDLDRAVELAPDVMAARLDRGLIKLAKGDLAGAEADVSAAIDGGYPETRLYFLRARIRTQRGNKSGAAEDRAIGFRIAPQTEADWQARALARLPGDPQAALKDLEQCLAEFPTSRLAYENRAYIEDAILKRPAEALAALDDAVRVDPTAATARATRGVLRARAGRFAEAREDAARAMELDGRPSVIYAVAGIYALTAQDRPADRDRALFLLSQAVHRGYGLEMIESDPELATLRALPEVRRLVAGAKQNSPRKPSGG